MKTKSVFGLLLSLLAWPCAAQDKTYNWVRASGETYQLNPAQFRAPHSYRPGAYGGNIQVDVEAQHPITLAIAQETDWASANENPELLAGIKYWCLQEHVVTTTYKCELPPSQVPMVLILRDERIATGAVLAGVGRVVKIPRSAPALIDPNFVQVTYYRWGCIENCFQPEFRWSRVAKEKFEITSVMKVYGLSAPQVDGEQLNVKIKSQVPLVLAVVPSNVANQLYGKPEMLQSAIANSQCQQRGVQTLTFGCTFKVSEGPQSLIVLPEQGSALPKHKKAEIELQSSRCVEHCVLPQMSRTGGN